jgi:hypothetical protein
MDPDQWTLGGIVEHLPGDWKPRQPASNNVVFRLLSHDMPSIAELPKP